MPAGRFLCSAGGLALSLVLVMSVRTFRVVVLAILLGLSGAGIAWANSGVLSPNRTYAVVGAIVVFVLTLLVVMEVGVPHVWSDLGGLIGSWGRGK
jgi:hypothetical protein